MTLSAPMTQDWRRRTGDDWARAHVTSTDRPQRAVLVRALETLEPFQSVVELGCGAAANLRRIHDRWPSVLCRGIDVNIRLLLAAFDTAVAEGWESLDLIHDDLITTGLPEVDVAFSCYALAYVHPDEIRAVLRRMAAVAHVGLVLLEPMRPALQDSVHVWGGTAHEWAHPYSRHLLDLHPDWHVETWPILPHIDRLNACLIAHRPRPERIAP